MKRLAILSALFVLAFVALLAGGVANARRAARERERILAAPVFRTHRAGPSSNRSKAFGSS